MAERSLSTRLTLKVAEFIRGGEAAKRSLTDLSRKFTETAGFASGFRKKLDDAFKKLPKIEIDANSTPAEVKIAELRSRLETLRDKRVGVDIDAGAALAEMHLIQRELAAIDDRDISFDVRAGVSGAMADLAAVDAEVSRLDGRNADVNIGADISGAMSGIATVGAALAALAAAPAIISIAGAGLALGGAFGAAGVGAAGMAAVALPALGRVNEALKEQESAAGGAGGATKSLAQKQAEAAAAAMRMAQAQERVRKANETVKDTARGVVQAQQDVKRAQDDVARASADGAARVADAVRRVSDAERQYTDAVKAAKDAQEALNDARQQAARDLEDIANRLTGTQLDLRTANLDLVDAKKRLDAVMANKKASSADIERATIAYEEAQLRVKELTTSVDRLQTDKAEADAKGVEGSDLVKSAQDQLAAANQRVVDSQQAIADAQAGVAQAQTEAARGVAAAQERVAAAQEKLIDAQRRYSDAQRDAIMAERQLKLEKLQQKAATEQAGAAAGGAASKMAELSKEERALARDIKAFQDDYKAWQQSLEGDVFPVISAGLDLVASQLPRISPLVKTAASSFLTLEKDAKKALEAPFWDRVLKDLQKAMPGAIEGLGRTAGNVFTGMVGIFDAFLPHAGDVVDSLERGSKKFSEWGQKLRDSPEFKAFIAYVKEQAPKVQEILSNVAIAAGNIFKAAGTVGPGALDVLVKVSEKLASLSPGQVQAIATGVGLIFSALKIGESLKLAGLLALVGIIDKLPPPALYAIAGGVTAIILAVKGGQALQSGIDRWGALRDRIGEVGESTKGAKGKIGAIAGVLGAGGPWGLAVAGGVTAIGLLADAHFKAQQKIDDMASALNEATGAITKEAKQSVVKGLIDDGTLQKAKSLGLNLKDVTDAALGNEAAIGRVNKALLKFAGEGVDPFHPKVKALGDSTKMLAGDAMILQQRILGSNETLDAAREKLQLNAEAQGKVFGAQQKLKTSYDETKRALNDANGSLDLNSAKTAAQRQAVTLAREKFSGFITDIRTTAESQRTLSGKTFDATKTVLDQLPHLMSLAGKNKEAKEQVLLLAKAYGISREDAIKAAKGGQSLKDVLDKLKSKSLKIDANTKPALDTINQLIRTAEGKTIRIGVDVRSDTQEHANQKGTKRESGGIDAYAAGGIRANRARGPKMATRPTVLFGEGRDKEAFIPYDQAFRSRAEMLLSQVAADFGLQLLPADNVASAVQSASSTLSGSLTETGSTLLSTLGGAGSLTSAVDELGTAADGLAGTMLDAINRLSDQINALDASIDALSSAVSSAGSVASSSASSAKSTSSAKKIGTAVSVTAKKMASTKVSASARKSTAAKKAQAKPKKAKVPIVGSGAGPSKPKKTQAGFIEPAEPMAWGGLVASPTFLAGEAGKEMVIPLDPSKRMRGLDLLRQAAGVMGADIMPKRSRPSTIRSRPIQGSTSAGSSVTPEMIEQIVVKMTDRRQRGDRTLHIENMNVHENISPRELAEEMHLLDRRG